MNDILMKRLCHLIAMNYAIDKETVWATFLELNSIDETIRVISHLKQ